MVKLLKYLLLLNLMLLCEFSFAQESEQLYPDTLLLRLIKEKQVKQVDIIDATGKERIIQSTYYNTNGDEILLKNFQNGYSYFQLIEKGKVRKKLIYSTTDIEDTLNAQDKYIHWFDELGNLQLEVNIINGKLFQTTEHKVSFSGDTCIMSKRNIPDGRISSIRVIRNGNMEWVDYISYNDYERISDVKSFYQMYNSHHQLIEEGTRYFDDTLEEYLIDNKFHLAELFDNDTLSRIILSGKLKPRYNWQKKYHYTNQLLDSFQDNMLTVKHITYNSKQLPDEVRCLYPTGDNNKEECGKIKFIYNELFLPTQVLQYDSEGGLISKMVYKYSF